jgi:hypothetical protein
MRGVRTHREPLASSGDPGGEDPVPDCPTIYGDQYTKYLTVRSPILPDESIQRITWQAKFDCHGNPTSVAPTLQKVGSEHFVEIYLGHLVEVQNEVTYPGLIQDCFIKGWLGGCQTEGNVTFTASLSDRGNVTYGETVETNDFGRFNTWDGYYELTDRQVTAFPY